MTYREWVGVLERILWASKCFAAVKQEWKCLGNESKNFTIANSSGIYIPLHLKNENEWKIIR